MEVHRNTDRNPLIRCFQAAGFDVVNMFPYGFWGLAVIHFLRHDIPRRSFTENLKDFCLLYPT